MQIDFRPPIGLALGSGAARGWSHIGVIRALEEARIRPEIICGASAGAVVGAFYAAGELNAFERFVRGLDRRQIMAYLDPTLRGGLLKARKIFDALGRHLPDRDIETLPRPFAAVATDLGTGHEVWLRKGSLLTALRASTAIPGLVTPEVINGRWLVDGGLVNPVPVSLCRALGAGSVIAVDLNTTLIRPSRGPEVVAPSAEPEKQPEPKPEPKPDKEVVAESDAQSADPDEPSFEAASDAVAAAGLLSTQTAARLLSGFQEVAADLLDQFGFEENSEPPGPPLPSIYEVMTGSLNIMQTRIGRSRMAGDPPELLITPRLEGFGLLEFDRADEAIAIGRRSVAHALAAR